MYSFVRFSLILAVACLLTATACTTKPETGPFAIQVRGKVVDAIDGFPLSGALISMWNDPDLDVNEGESIIIPMAITYTDSTGFYSIEKPFRYPPGSFPIGITISKHGYLKRFTYIECKSGFQTFDIRLVPY